MKSKVIRGIMMTLLLVGMLTLAFNIQKAESPESARIYVDPLISYAGAGETFSTNVNVADIANLYGFEFKLGYNTIFLDAIDVVIQPFLNEPTYVFREEINDEYNATFGFVWVSVTSQYPAEEVNGSGTLATITFQVTGLGGCALGLYDTKLSDPDGVGIDHSVEDGYYESGRTQVVSTESEGNSYEPSLAVDSSGNVHIAWDDETRFVNGYDSGTDSDVFYKKFVAGSGWTITEVVSTESAGDSYDPSLAVDSSGNVHVAWYDYTRFVNGYDSGTDLDIFYKNRTSSWSTTEVVSTESTATSLPPSLAVDSSGNVHVAWYDYTRFVNGYDSGTDLDIFYKNRTSSWSTTEVVSTESTAYSYTPSLAVDSSGNIHIAWPDETNYTGCGSDMDVFYKNRTSSWSTTEVVSTESTASSNNPSLAVDSSGNIHIAWYDETNYTGCGSDRDIFYKRYEVGLNWTSTEVVSTESTGECWRPSLAVDLAGDVHIAWDDETEYGGSGPDWDIFYKYLRLYSTQYPWPMFHHNLRHTGHTESPAPNTNKTQWTYTTSDDVYSSPAVVDGKVYVGSDDRKVYCLNAATGALIWNYTTGGFVRSSPAVDDGKVYVGSYDNKTYCLDAATGAHIWNYTAGHFVWSSPAVADGRVYVGSHDKKVYCLNASAASMTPNEREIWNYTTGGSVYSSPAVVDGKVYVGSYDDYKVYCLNAATGAHIWNYTIGMATRSSPAVAGGKVYIGSQDAKVYCLNAANGAPIWNYTTGGFVRSCPAVVDGKVYVGSYDDKVYCLNASAASMTPNEREIWNYPTGDWVSCSPAVADGKVYVGSRDNKTYCLDASTGAKIWSYTTGSAVHSSPSVADGMVFIGSSDGKVYAFGHVVRVPEDYPTIQEAIDAACTIIVAPGTYYENLVINKSLTIIGRKGSNGPIFDGTITGTLVTITNTSKVTITNIIMTNYEKAVLIENSSECTIYNNIMYNLDYSGTAIESDNAANNLIYNNILQDNDIAIDLTESSTSNIIYANTISGNEIGIDMSDSNDNIIYHNNFVDNNFQAISNPSLNTWDNGAEGNYWSDYEDRYPNAKELDGSGIWDTPYEINENNADRYPLMRPFSGIGITNVTTSKTVIGQGFTLSINLTILNYGINDEDSTVTVYANTKRIAMRTITLTNRNSTTITFTWNTAGVPCGNYTITAKADPVPYERETTDNTGTCWVKVTVVGDVNGDYRASVADMVEVDIALGTEPGEPNYNPNADVNCDGSISVADMVVIDIHLGEEC